MCNKITLGKWLPLNSDASKNTQMYEQIISWLNIIISQAFYVQKKEKYVAITRGNIQLLP